MLNQNLLLAGDDAYNLERSLRFRSSASAYLSRTPASASNRKTWTWSGWVKRGSLGVSQYFFSGGTGGSDTTQFGINFLADDKLNWLGGSGTQYRTTTQVFRDPSAWYHIVLAFDTTLATANDRIKIYVNGTQITAFSNLNNPSQNVDYGINQAQAHNIGRWTGASGYFDGYMTEINFIDGQALTPSSFGETSATTGVWIPKKYTGTYGTNGFYLPFTNTTSTSTLGNDFSGNSNTWTVNNISLTAGDTYDSMNDVPTLTNATTANYCVVNPLVYRNSVGQNGYSNGNLTLSGLGSAVAYFNMATVGVNASSGKFYWECQIGTASSGIYIGVTQDSNFQSGNWDAWYDSVGGVLYKGGTSFASVATATTNDVIAIAYDSTANTCAFYKNNTLLGTVTGLTSATMFPLQCARTSAVLNLNFGQQPLAYTPPTGFVALNTFNLPTPTIGATASTTANKYFNPVLYTGTGSSPLSISGVNFQPDFVWIKDRTGANNHCLFDAVRGVQLLVNSNTTSAEQTFSTSLISFNSDGFTLGNYGNVNLNSSSNYVSWNWKANGSGVTNTAGTITSTVSANTTAGFSVVTATTPASYTSYTAGHGLGVTPSMIIYKERTGTSNWWVWHTSFTTATNALQLNTTSAILSGAYFGTQTSTVAAFSGVQTSLSAGFVAYCFAQVAGYSAFGSYTGNGSSDGPFVFTGFRPRFILIKASSFSTASTVWTLFDTSRNPYNAAVNELYANLSSAEGVDSSGIDILSNGFKPKRNSEYANSNGQTYIYMAVAENPFKYANAR